MTILIFTGAGISRESGLNTFRDSDGLWEGHRVQDVCSVAAWETQPEVVLEFYNARRRDVLAAEPNAAHRAIAALEESGHEVVVVTQNIDDLHERAGSSRVIHLHGEILKAHSEHDRDAKRLIECRVDMRMGDLSPDTGQLRPHVVFFGEAVQHLYEALEVSVRADVLLVVGTTLLVTPAAYVATETGAEWVWVVDPRQPSVDWGADRIVRRIAEPATVGVPMAAEKILSLLGPS